MSEKSIKNMFNYQGKTVNVIGKTRVKTYKELYEYIDQLQKTKDLPQHNDYLGGNELANNIYEIVATDPSYIYRIDVSDKINNIQAYFV